MDIKTEFTKFCGPSVLFGREERAPRTITIIYTIPAIDDDPRRVTAHLRNGLESVLRAAVKKMADSARNDAYHRTGHRDADMQRLLSGRTV